MKIENARHTCVYTDEPLTDKTTFEHVIPRKLGGKIASNEIMSSKLNNSFSKIDNAIFQRYCYVLHMLSYFMSKRTQPGQMGITIPAIENGKYKLVQGRIVPSVAVQKVVIKDMKCIMTDADTTIPSIFKTETNNVKFLLISELEDQFGDNFSFWRDLVSPDFDLALIKIAIGSVVLYALEKGNEHFRKYIKRTSKLLYSAILDDKKVEDCILKHSFGFQAEKLGYFLRLIKKKYGEVEPFCHYVIGFTNPTTRTLDVMIILFGCEAYGVRLASNCNEPLGFILKNGIFKDDKDDPKKFEHDDETEIICTERKSVLQRDPGDLDGHFYLQMDSMNKLVTDSIYFAEVNSIERFKQSLQMAKGYWQVNPENCEYQSLGEYMTSHVRAYFSRSNPELAAFTFDSFTRFNDFKFTKQEFQEEVLNDAFIVLSNKIQLLASKYGKPVVMVLRETEFKKTKGM